MGFPASWARVRANSSLRSRHEGRNLAQDALAFEGGQAARGAEGFDGGGDGGFGVLAAALHDAGDQAAVIGGVDLDEVAVFPPAAIHKETVRRNGRDRHLCHDFLWPPENRLERL